MSSATKHKVAKAKLAAAYNALHAIGLFDFAGDVSLRLEDGRFLIRAARAHVGPETGRSKVVTTADDIIVVSPAGEMLEGEGTLSSELITHTALYQARPELRSVLHAHARMVSVVSMVERTIMACHSRGVEVTSGDGPPFYDSVDGVSSPEQAERLVRTLGAEQGVMLRSHGIVTVGPTLESACNTAVNMEDAALMYWMAKLIGQPTPLPEPSLASRKQLWADPAFASSVWSYWEELGVRASAALRPGVTARSRKAL